MKVTRNESVYAFGTIERACSGCRINKIISRATKNKLENSRFKIWGYRNKHQTLAAINSWEGNKIQILQDTKNR